MDLHLFVNRERENLYQARFLADSARQRSAVMAFIPDRNYLVFFTTVHPLSPKWIRISN